MDDLWGPSAAMGTNASVSLGFEDSFSPQEGSQVEDTAHCPNQENYVPLQDSQQYLAGLESKLAHIQGRTASNRKTESRRLLDALAGSRSNQTAQLMQDSESSCGSIPIMDTPPSLSTIDPQGALGAMLRRVAPDRVALTPEELCRLLQADLLAQMHESENDASPDTHGPVRDKNHPPGNTRSQDKTSAKHLGTGEPREPSSDEGEK